MAKATTRIWDPAEHLQSEEDMAAYLEAALWKRRWKKAMPP